MSEISRRRFFGVTLGGIAAALVARFLPAAPPQPIYDLIDFQIPENLLLMQKQFNMIDHTRIDTVDLSAWGSYLDAGFQLYKDSPGSGAFIDTLSLPCDF